MIFKTQFLAVASLGSRHHIRSTLSYVSKRRRYRFLIEVPDSSSHESLTTGF